MDIYTTARNFVLSTFSGREDHQELRKKIIKLSLKTRLGIKACAANMGCASKKDQVSEAVYWILNDLRVEPMAICPTCSKLYHGKYYSIVEGYRFHGHCSTSCRNRDLEYAKKLAATNFARGGHVNNMHGVGVREKTKQRWIEKYGVDNPLKAEEIKTKVRTTNQNRRGVERYGVQNPMQHPAIFKKTLRGLKSTKRGTLPSGTQYTYQGYENVAVDNLLGLLQEHEVHIGDPTKIPVIEYFNPVKEKSSKYFPDIWVPHLNLLVEVKSTWTMRRQFVENMAKHHAALRLGFRHEIWICSKDQVLEVLL